MPHRTYVEPVIWKYPVECFKCRESIPVGEAHVLIESEPYLYHLHGVCALGLAKRLIRATERIAAHSIEQGATDALPTD